MENGTSSLSAREKEMFGAILDLDPGDTVITIVRRSMASFYLSHLMGGVVFWVILSIVHAVLFTGFGAFIDPAVQGILGAVFFYVTMMGSTIACFARTTRPITSRCVEFSLMTRHGWSP